MQQEDKEKEESLAGMPAFIKSWNQAYALLLGFLLVLILLFYWFTEAWK